MAVKQFDVALSLAGRDTGSLYVVSQLIDENHCLVIDGKTKPILKPKKKKFKHICKTNFFADGLAQKIAQGAYMQDAEVRKTLKFFKNNL